ncbi:iron-siderophore ABC transporter substrate-binding protein [Marinomonas sp. M1K-6]|uniref:Iron-siderophore ABC transporter substrate-binding protein n=2 Tax=Marinomonas profundi TaxID=2726122 RepID=A0A847R544_9GAMM|nr:iron-siderophore ABC transporter substrate-binding protein [Marinomonas profundi]UDV04875.1 iron-siderophore ABC transporter substrate-binding protein [Marinomonas profundi]
MLCMATFFTSLHTQSLPTEKPSPRVMSIDWTQTETLLALGIQPIAVAQKSGYDSWVKAPAIPDTTEDVGLRSQPNLERLTELQPERIFISPMFRPLTPKLSKIAPVTEITLYKQGNITWDGLKTFTRTLAQDVNKPQAAEDLIHKSEQQLNNLANKTPQNTPPLLMIQFMDSRHVRVFGANSIYKIAANKLGLQSAWQNETNAWGFSLVGIDELIGLDSQIVIIKPLPIGVADNLQQDRYWQYLVNKTGRPALMLDPTWSFGAIPSTVRFAEQLSAALLTQPHSQENP